MDRKIKKLKKLHLQIFPEDAYLETFHEHFEQGSIPRGADSDRSATLEVVVDGGSPNVPGDHLPILDAHSSHSKEVDSNLQFDWSQYDNWEEDFSPLNDDETDDHFLIGDLLESQNTELLFAEINTAGIVSSERSNENRNSNSNCAADETESPYFDFSLNKLISPSISKSNITDKDFLILQLANAVRFQLSYEALIAQFKIATLCRVGSQLPSCKRSLWKLLCRDDSCIVCHAYCKNCLKRVGKKGSIDTECSCLISEPKEVGKNISYFIEIDVKTQLNELLKTPKIAENLNYRFSRKKKNPNSKEDIFDGDQYQKMCQAGAFLDNPYNFSFNLFTDGCSVIKSGKTSVWPIFLMINELPPQSRKKNVILFGIWVDKVHPIMNEYLFPFVQSIRELYYEGVMWKPDGKNEVISKFAVTLSSVDSKARSPLMNMTNLNGECGCTFCYAPGKIDPAKPLHRWYPFDKDIILRTDEQFRSDMAEAHETSSTVKGVKGPSIMMALPEFDLGIGMTVESMHNVDLGVIKKHTELLLFSKASNEYYFGNPENLRRINHRLTKIRPPNLISRKPRPIETCMSWKASEWRNWALYYCLFCLEDVVEKSYLDHLKLFTRAIYILNGESISEEDLIEAEQLLSEYVRIYEIKFGEKKMTYNVHLLRHLTNTVRNWGPLWANNAYVFESWNKKIIDKITSPHDQLSQIVTRYFITKYVVDSVNDRTLQDETRNFISSLMQKHDYILCGKTCKPTGRFVVAPLTRVAIEALKTAGFTSEVVVHFYKKAEINGVEYRCDNYRVETKFDNSIAYSSKVGFCVIKDIVCFTYQNCVKKGLFIEHLRTVNVLFGNNYIEKVIPTKQLIYVPMKSIIGPGILMKSIFGMYVVRVANCCESD